MHFLKKPIALLAVAGISSFISGCSKERLQINQSEQLVNGAHLSFSQNTLDNRKSYARKIAKAFYEVVCERKLYMPTLNFKGKYYRYQFLELASKTTGIANITRILLFLFPN